MSPASRLLDEVTANLDPLHRHGRSAHAHLHVHVAG